jgi:hypothetical protein
VTTRAWHWFWLAWIAIGFVWLGMNMTLLHHGRSRWVHIEREKIRHWAWWQHGASVACYVGFWPCQIGLTLGVWAAILWRRRAARR